MNGLHGIPKDEDTQLQVIKEILLNNTSNDIQDIRDLLNKQDRLSQQIDPVLEEKILYIKDNFDKIFGNEVEELVDRRLAESPEQLLAVISPMLGRLIKKYIAHQFQMLRDNIDQNIRQATSTQGVVGRIKAKLFGIKNSDMILSNIDSAVIKEIYVIKRHSGIVLGSYSIDNTIDRDMIGGMLTAIKAFVEDAISDEEGKGEELEKIQYGNYKIFIQNFYNYYIAVVMSGTISSSDENELSDNMINFAEKELSTLTSTQISANSDMVSNKLKEYFS